MKTNLRTFPESERTPIDLPYQKWKRAFEKELREALKRVDNWHAKFVIKEVLGE